MVHFYEESWAIYASASSIAHFFVVFRAIVAFDLHFAHFYEESWAIYASDFYIAHFFSFFRATAAFNLNFAHFYEESWAIYASDSYIAHFFSFFRATAAFDLYFAHRMPDKLVCRLPGAPSRKACEDISLHTPHTSLESIMNYSSLAFALASISFFWTSAGACS